MDSGINYEGYEQVIMLCYTIHTITQFIPKYLGKKKMIGQSVKLMLKIEST